MRVEETGSEQFKVRIALRQGFDISPYLLNLYVKSDERGECECEGKGSGCESEGRGTGVSGKAALMATLREETDKFDDGISKDL